jgi:hypothetical protein
MEGLPEGLCETVMAEMKEGLLKNRYGRIVFKDILTRINTSVEF